MEELVKRIQQDGNVLGDGVLKVDSLINHQVDPQLMKNMGELFAKVFAEERSRKLLRLNHLGLHRRFFVH